METDISKMAIPAHVALILDGNGRWAKKRGLPRTAGHKQGCVTVEKTVEDAARLGMEQETAANTGMTFVIAVNYGGRDEIRRAVSRMMKDTQAGVLNPDQVTEETVASYLDTAGIPDPDLLIRTSGEIRLSNYLLWQLAYSEIYITDCLWPDFNRDELVKAIAQYNTRERRFGGAK